LALNTARMKSLYDTAQFALDGKTFVDLCTKYFTECSETPAPVSTSKSPKSLIEIASASLDSHRPFGELCAAFLDHAQRIHSPHYMGHQVPAVLPHAGLFDALNSVTNQGMAVYEMGPFSMAIERAIVAKLTALVGWSKDASDGIATSGGTLANLTALLTARNVRYPESWDEGNPIAFRPAIITSAEAHYSMSRACGVLGLGSNQVIKAPVDSQRRLDAKYLPLVLQKAKQQRLDVFAIVGSLPSTPIGAFDDLPAIAEFAKANKLWFHVDGAHGASVLFSKIHRELAKGIELADSVTWDAHKMLFVPSLCTYVLFKNRQHSFSSFKQQASYLFAEKDEETLLLDGGLRTFECTRRGLSTALWGVWSLFGEKVFGELIDHTFALTLEFYGFLKKQKDFTTVHVPQGNIICFRYVPASLTDRSDAAISAMQVKVRDKLQASKEFYTTITKIDDVYALRLTIINPLTEMKHLQLLLDTLRALEP
jgi:L-2,4-diaminobutyrate decarboxylase